MEKREQMYEGKAKKVYATDDPNLLNLKVSDFKAAKTEFTDVPAWAAPYVAACKADGIIAGYSATYFGANDTVTAAQAGLMILKALGYFQYAADFGDSWQLATVKQASKIDLYDGIAGGVDVLIHPGRWSRRSPSPQQQ